MNLVPSQGALGLLTNGDFAINTIGEAIHVNYGNLAGMPPDQATGWYSGSNTLGTGTAWDLSSGAAVIVDRI